jgi:hypothetical protein
VAVLDFEPTNSSASDAAAVTEFLRSALIDLNVWTVVERKHMSRILAEQAMQQTGCTSQDCAVKLGRVLNVSKVIVGTFGIVERTRFITARLVDVETGINERSAKASGFQLREIDGVAERIARQLVYGESGTQSTPAASTSAASVLVMKLETQGVGALEALAVESRVRRELGKAGLGVVPREYMEKFPDGTCPTDDCHIRLGRTLGARVVVTGSFGVPADPAADYSRFLSLRLMEVATGETVIRKSAKLKQAGDFEKVVTDFVVAASRVALSSSR